MKSKLHQEIKIDQLNKYGFENPQQVPEISDKNSKKSYRRKIYIMPSGNQIICQGYEPFALNKLINEDKTKLRVLYETNKILNQFPDPENKIKIVHGQFSEKDDQCRAYMQHINDDIDYIWNLDSDEVYKTEDGGLIKLIWCSNVLCDYNERKQVFQNYK